MNTYRSLEAMRYRGDEPEAKRTKLSNEDLNVIQPFDAEDNSLLLEYDDFYNAHSKYNEEDSYEVFSDGEINKCMQHQIKCLSEILQLPEPFMRVLLARFQWDSQKLMEAYYAEDSGSGKVLFQFSNFPGAAVSPDEPLLMDCEICCEEKRADDMFGLACGHRFCKPCWVGYLTTQIQNEGNCQIACIAPNCNAHVDDYSVMNLITDDSVKRRYQDLVIKNFILSHPQMRWCPSPGCTNAIKVKVSYPHSNLGIGVTCKCGSSFCFNCSEASHSPISCDMLKRWEYDIRNYSKNVDSQKWIDVNTKQCPKCHANIQKNGGCNFMSCPTCRQSFCWECLKPLTVHIHVCSFVYSAGNTSRKQQDKSKESLKRYLFYFDRFNNHKYSLQLERRLYDAVVESTIRDLQLKGQSSWIESQYLKTAIDVLSRCRQTLMYTYVFSYYHREEAEDSQFNIFKGNQQDLHNAVENLSEQLERGMQNHSNQTIQDLALYCDGRCKVLIEHIQEGHDNDCWKFTPNDNDLDSGN